MEQRCDLPPTAFIRNWVWLLFCGVVFVVGRLGEEEDDVDEVPRKWIQGERFFRLERIGGRMGRHQRRLGLVLAVLLLLEFGRCRQNWTTGDNCPRFLCFPPQKSAASKFRRDRMYWTLAASLFYLFHLRSCATSVVGARQPGNHLGFIEGALFPIFRDILQGMNQLLDPLKGIIQLFYFCFLTIWAAKSRDICRGLILLLEIGAWVMEQHLPAELCSLVSLGEFIG